MFSTTYKRYVLAMLTTVYTLNFVDRGLVALLLQPIKEDLDLSDTQLGFLTGIAFGLFYATLGVPIARWADRGNRVTITSLAIGLWGLTVMACVLVSNFVQLMCARIAAGVGEAGCMPPTYSLLGDYFREGAGRVRAMGIYMLASPLASLVAFIIGGWLNGLYGWRMTFLIMGMPAILVAIVVKITIREPRMEQGAISQEELRTRMTDVLRILWRQPSSRHLSIGLVVLCMMGLGMAPWYAAFLIRSHGMSTTELGMWLGLIFGFGGMAGAILGGYLSGAWFAHNERGQLRLSALAVASLTPFFILFLLLPSKLAALAVFIPLNTMWCICMAPVYAMMQRLVPDEMRATMIAVVMLFANLVGMGIGPQIVGVLSDGLAPAFGIDSLRYAMLVVSFVALWSAYHYWRAGQTVRADLTALAQSARRDLREVSVSGLEAQSG